jgi:DNA uptake protein ComE-like DNA-binding protein
MLTYIRTKYIVQKNSIQLKSNQLQRIFFPFFKTTIVAKKKINLNIAYIKELQKYKGLGNTTNN